MNKDYLFTGIAFITIGILALILAISGGYGSASMGISGIAGSFFSIVGLITMIIGITKPSPPNR